MKKFVTECSLLLTLMVMITITFAESKKKYLWISGGTEYLTFHGM